MDLVLAEDEPMLADLIARGLTGAGHAVRTASTGPAAFREVSSDHCDLIVLDVNLPGCDGFEVLRQIREAGLPIRVLMLTACSGVGDRVAGLKAGADDYLTKPFAMEELLARVEALGRRRATDEPDTILRVGDLVMDAAKRRVSHAGTRIELSPREYQVLEILLREPGRTFSRDEICERIWEREHEYDTRTVEIFILRLRRKLDSPGGPSLIRTVRSVGYVIDPTP
jgi:DNA-binding response OmpR family regulator